MRIGVVSDNHGRVDPALVQLLQGVDEIWHAGDLVTGDIVPVLEAIAPLRVVRGNNDVGPGVRTLPEEDLFEREGWRILIRHIVGEPPRLDPAARRSITRLAPTLVVMGHSHRPMAVADGGVIYLNPGSCGPRRFSLPRAAGILELSASEARFGVSDLEGKGTIIDRSFALPSR